MTWTFDETDLSTDLAKVRVDIGDTNTKDQLLSDEIINHYLSVTTLTGATLRAAQACYAKLWRDVDRSNLGMSASRSQKLQQLRDLIDDLKKRQNRRATPFVGGVSQASKDALADDSDLVDARFKRGQWDNV